MKANYRLRINKIKKIPLVPPLPKGETIVSQFYFVVWSLLRRFGGGEAERDFVKKYQSNCTENY